MKKSLIISIYMATSITTNCLGQTDNQNTMNQKLPEYALCFLSESKYSLTYLTSVSLLTEDKYKEKLIGNGDYFLIYHSESKKNDNSGDYYTNILHIIPESDGRYKIEIQTTERGKYINVESHTIDYGFNIELTYKWRFAGYSDDMDSEAAKVLKYYNETIIQDVNETRLSKNAVLVEEWTIKVHEVHLKRYYFVYSFYDNGQFILKREGFSNVPDCSTIGIYHYQPETDKFFLTFSDETYYENQCIKAVEEKSYGRDRMTVMYYKWGIDTSGNYYTCDEGRIRRSEYLERKILK